MISGIEEFESAVMQLQQDIRSAGIGWSDRNYMQIAESIRSLSNESANAVSSGRRFNELIRQFDTISSRI